jgi:hypothetical protein
VPGKKYREVIADNLSKAGWSWGCVSAIDSNGRTIWIADAHRDDGKRFVVHADEKLTVGLTLSRARAPRRENISRIAKGLLGCHCGRARSVVVHADEKLTVFLELEGAIQNRQPMTDTAASERIASAV